MTETYTSDFYFSQLIRAFCDEIQKAQNVSGAMTMVNRHKMKALLEHIAVQQNTSFLELGDTMGVSKRTLGKLSAKDGDIMLPMRSSTLVTIMEYAYDIAETYENL